MTARALWLTARPKTLAASIVPVLVGCGLSVTSHQKPAIWIAVFAVLSAMMIQVGTNYVNDALDFEKGADRDSRLGEARAAHQGWFTSRTLLILGTGAFAMALSLGIPLVVEGGWPILLIGVFSLAMGYAYTGGPYPLAYVGLGDIFVLLFFGLVAVGGIYYLESKTYNLAAFVAGLQVGMLATVLIAINNLRDLDQDRTVGKMTLAVRLGPKLGRIEVLALVLAAFSLNFFWLRHGYWYAFALPFAALPLGVHVVRTLLSTQASAKYNQLLARAAAMHMLFGIMLSVGLYLR